MINLNHEVPLIFINKFKSNYLEQYWLTFEILEKISDFEL